MGIRQFDELKVWQKAHHLTLVLYGLELSDWNIRDQLRRAAISISANISEGCGRASNKEFIRYLIISRGSLEECRYLIILIKDLGYISSPTFERLALQAEEVSKMLNGLIKYLRHQP